MSEAPERIWICPLSAFTDGAHLAVRSAIATHRENAMDSDTPYTRTDIADAALAAEQARADRMEALAVKSQVQADAALASAERAKIGWANALKEIEELQLQLDTWKGDLANGHFG